MRRLTLPLVLTSLLFAACGDEGPPPAPKPKQDTPEAVLESFRKASIAGQWDVVYALHLPSERAKAEARWLEARKHLVDGGPLDRLARKAGRKPEELSGLTLPEVFALVRAEELAASGPKHLDRVKHLEFLRTEPMEDEPDAVLVKFQFGPAELGMPMKTERARWWVYKSLEAFVDG